ncbi:hypothetical protein GW17_00024065, partial [Ensete ventricosum]
EGSARVNKDQHNSANPTADSVIGELKQHGGSKFDYSTTATGSQRGVLQPKQKIEDSAKCEEMQRLHGKARTARYIPVRQLTGMRTSRYRAVPALAACGLRVTAGDFSFRLPARGEIEATVVASSFANSLFSTFSFMLFSFSFLLFPLLSLFIWSRWYTPLQLLIRLSVLVPKRKDHINYMIEPQKELYRF